MREPFQLLLHDAAEPLYCNDIIRIIPGKRLVAFASWGEKEVVAKLFYQRGKAKRHLKRDVLGIDALVQANVPTPRLLYQGSASNSRVQVLLFEKILQAKNLEEIWQEQKNLDEFAILMHQVIVELATQHVLGILQRDLHLKNFLVTEQKIYTLDGGTIEKFADVLNKKQSMDNLSLLFAQLGVGTEHLQRELFKTYAKLRGWIIKQADLDLLNKAVVRKNKERWQRYKKKIVRTCTTFVKMTRWNQVSVYDRDFFSPALLDFLQNPEKIFTQPGIVFLKAGRSATVAKVMLDNRYFVVKRYNMKNYWHWLRRCLRPTRAATSWRLAQYLRLFGIATARPVAYLEKRFFGLRMRSYFVMEYVAKQNIGEFLSDYKNNEEYFTKIADSIINMFHKLSELKITHGDLKMANILLVDNNPILIDLDAMQEHITRFGFNRAFKGEIKRFMKNWKDHPRAALLFNNLKERIIEISIDYKGL